MPGVRAVFGVVKQGFEKRRLHAFEIAFGFADDVAGDKFGRIFKHVDEAVELAQDVVGQVVAGCGFAINIDGDVGVFAPHFGDEGAQVEHDRIELGAGGEFFVVNG